MSKKYFVVIEGLDGSGKSTICKKLSNELNWELYITPPCPFNQIRIDIDRNANSETRYFFYLASVLHASKEIKEILKRNHVVCDRYIYSTVCYHFALNPNLAYFDIGHLDILKPDYIFYLDASYEERVRRIAKRDNMKIENIMNDKYGNRDFSSKVEKEFNKLKEIIKINTENHTIDEIVIQIKEIIGGGK